MQNSKNQRFFSIELNSQGEIKNLSMTHENQTLIEGTIGNLVAAKFTEGVIFEVTGTKGTLRLDLRAEEIGANKTAGVQ